MKKVLSFVLVLAMILGSVSMVFAQPWDGVATITKDNTVLPFVDAEDSYVATVLRDLGAVDGVGDDKVNPTGELTRAEGYAMIVKAMGLKDQAEAAKNTKTKFSDVEVGSWLNGYVAVAAAQKYTDGTGNGKFSPDAKMSKDEAVAAVLKVLGYDAAHLAQAWPVNYRDLSLSLNVLTNVNTGADVATRANMMQIIYNCLGKSFVSWVKDKDSEGAAYVGGKFVSPENAVKLVERMTGIDDTKCYSGVYNKPSNVGNAKVLTPKSFTFANKFDAKNFYGKAVEVLTKNGNSIGIAKVYSKTLTGTFTKNATTVGFTADGVVYTGLTTDMVTGADRYVNGGLTTKAIDLNVLNNRTTYTFEVILDETTPTKITKLCSMKYDVVDETVLVNVTQAALLANANLYEYTKSEYAFDHDFATTTNGIKKNVVLDPKATLVVEGAATALSEIQENDVLEISLDYATNKITKILVTRNVVKAALEDYYDDQLVFGGVAHKTVSCDAFNVAKANDLANMNAAIKGTSEYAFYLNSKDAVVYAELTAEKAAAPKARYAIVLDATSTEEYMNTPLANGNSLSKKVTNNALRLLPLDTMVEEDYELVSVGAMSSTGDALTVDSWVEDAVVSGQVIKFSVKDGNLYTLATVGAITTTSAFTSNVATFGATLDIGGPVNLEFAADAKFVVVGAGADKYVATEAGYYVEKTLAELNKTTGTAFYKFDKNNKVDVVVVYDFSATFAEAKVTVAAITTVGRQLGFVNVLAGTNEIKAITDEAVGYVATRTDLYELKLTNGEVSSYVALAYESVAYNDELTYNAEKNTLVSDKAVLYALASDVKFLTCTTKGTAKPVFAFVDKDDVVDLFDAEGLTRCDVYVVDKAYKVVVFQFVVD